jgi:hypothetical protein
MKFQSYREFPISRSFRKKEEIHSTSSGLPDRNDTQTTSVTVTRTLHDHWQVTPKPSMFPVSVPVPLCVLISKYHHTRDHAHKLSSCIHLQDTIVAAIPFNGSAWHTSTSTHTRPAQLEIRPVVAIVSGPQKHGVSASDRIENATMACSINVALAASPFETEYATYFFGA